MIEKLIPSSLLRHDFRIKREDCWHLIEIILILGTLIFAYYQLKASVDIFNANLEIQKQDEIDQHISNIQSLEMELKQNMQLINNLINRREELVERKIIHGQLVLENLKRSVVDGKISNELLKNFTVKALFEGEELNQRILFVNSPEFSSLTIQNIKVDTIKGFKNETISFAENIYKPTFTRTLSLVERYKNCLINTRDIEFCNKQQTS